MSVSRRQALRITAVAGLGFAFGGATLREISRLAGLAEVKVTRRQLGTRVTISALHPDRGAADAMVEAAFGTMERLESILSRHRRGTAVDRLNTTGTVTNPPAELVAVLRRALEIARATDGAFDPTVRPLLALYEGWAERGPAVDRDRDAERRPGSERDPIGQRGVGPGPTPDAIEAALSLVDYRDLLVSERAVSLARPGMSITLDGIAKGYVVDRATQTLLAGGAERVMVEAGGDLAAGRRPDASGTERGWRLAIQDPRAVDGMLGVVSIRGEGMASSGDYVQSFTADRSLHHILDPRTGRSPTDLAAATVIAPDAMDADALSTTAMVLGEKDALRLIDGRKGVAGLLVTKDGRRIASRDFGRYVTPERA